jgi:hypothetical protein
MQNIRLDFIRNIEENAIEMMTDIRNEYLALDMSIQDFEEAYPEISNEAGRCISIARTNLETSLQYAIKALCLLGEIKE